MLIIFCESVFMFYEGFAIDNLDQELIDMLKKITFECQKGNFIVDVPNFQDNFFYQNVDLNFEFERLKDIFNKEATGQKSFNESSSVTFSRICFRINKLNGSEKQNQVLVEVFYEKDSFTISGSKSNEKNKKESKKEISHSTSSEKPDLEKRKKLAGIVYDALQKSVAR